jgi:hypothetical protein
MSTLRDCLLPINKGSLQCHCIVLMGHAGPINALRNATSWSSGRALVTLCGIIVTSVRVYSKFCRSFVIQIVGKISLTLQNFVKVYE